MTKSCQLGVLSIACALAASGCFAAVQIYHIEPREYHAGWTVAGPSTYVGQSFVACADSLDYIEWLVGDLSQAGRYKFDILDAATNQLVCWGSETLPPTGWRWIRCDSFDGDLRFTKGREYAA